MREVVFFVFDLCDIVIKMVVVVDFMLVVVFDYKMKKKDGLFVIEFNCMVDILKELGEWKIY